MSTNEEAFKIVLHSDEAFPTYLERMGSDSVRETLQGMRMRLETQINKWGTEREDWHKKATSLLTVVNVRLEEVSEWENNELAVYKELLQEFLERTQENLNVHDIPLPDVHDVDAVGDWLDEVGI